MWEGNGGHSEVKWTLVKEEMGAATVGLKLYQEQLCNFVSHSDPVHLRTEQKDRQI